MKILLSLSRENRREYFQRCFSSLDAVLCGGYLPENDPSADALILGGGGDLCPREGEDPALFFDVDACREEWEMALLADFAAKKKPVLGICRGHQLLARCYGGTLLTRLTREELHRSEGKECYHCVWREEGCFLCDGLAPRFSVYSNHHHGVDLTGSVLRKAAFSADDLCEALEHPELPLWGVQWHPERMAGGEEFFASFLRWVKGAQKNTCGSDELVVY